MPKCELTWLGQTGFMLVSNGTKLLIDPFFSDHDARLYPGPPLGICGHDVTALMITHEHLDHLDQGLLETLVVEHPEIRVVLPTPIIDQVSSVVRDEHIVAVQPGDRVRLGTVDVDVVPAYHALSVEEPFSDGRGSDGLARFVGYVLRTPKLSVYHAGDTIATPELIETLNPVTVDIALLPVNGRDYFREQAGVVGNLTSREAVQLAVQLGAAILVPTHWDMFDGNTEQPGRAVDEARALAPEQLHVLVMARYAPMAFG